MRKLALAIPVLTVLAVLSMPDEAEAQARCRSNTALCLGDKNNDVIVGGNLSATSPDGGLTITRGTGAISSGASISTSGTLQAAVIDAGALWVRGNEQHAGTLQGATKIDVVDAGYGLFNGPLQVDGNLILTASTTKTTCTLNGASPSVCTATVRASSTCTCSPVGATAALAAAGCALGLSGTTLTVTSLNGGTHVVNIHCF